MKNSYRVLRSLFSRRERHDSATSRAASDLPSTRWVPHTLPDGASCACVPSAPSAEIPAGNGGLVSAVTSAVGDTSRSGVLIKAPSNDPLTAIAIAARGGRRRTTGSPALVALLERRPTCPCRILSSRSQIEKIVAWGGLRR